MIVVLSGPSGVGKSTLANALLERHPDLRLSVSHTTRAPRGGERDGTHYHFVSEAHFSTMQAEKAFAEHARVFGCRYGTAHATLQQIETAGGDALLDIDYQGAEQITAAYPNAVTVLVAPPSMSALEQRLRGRKTESASQIERRLAKARLELSQFRMFRYVVVNDGLDAAARTLSAVYRAERSRVSEMEGFMSRLIEIHGG